MGVRILFFFKLVFCIALCLFVGIIGSIFTTSAISGWYVYLVKPSFTPPDWVFGPVWTLLFALMGIAAFMVWQKGLKSVDVRRALAFFIVQLALNALWPIVFFGLHSPGGALIEIIFLWAAILATILSFLNVSRLAAWLLIPYILWVSFAVYLNYFLWVLN